VAVTFGRLFYSSGWTERGRTVAFISVASARPYAARAELRAPHIPHSDRERARAFYPL